MCRNHGKERQGQRPRIRASNKPVTQILGFIQLNRFTIFGRLSLGDDDVNALHSQKITRTQLPEENPYRDDDVELERGDNIFSRPTENSKRNRGSRLIWVVGLLCLGGWILAFVLFWGRRNSELSSSIAAVHGADSATGSTSYGKPLTLDGVLNGSWGRRRHSISWVAGPNGQDGLLLERDEDEKKAYLRVESIHSRQNQTDAREGWVLMESGAFAVNGKSLQPSATWPSPDFKSVLVAANAVSNWRHSLLLRIGSLTWTLKRRNPLIPTNPKAAYSLRRGLRNPMLSFSHETIICI